MIHVTQSTPMPAIIFGCLLSLAMLMVKDVYALINYLTFAEFLFVGESVGRQNGWWVGWLDDWLVFSAAWLVSWLDRWLNEQFEWLVRLTVHLIEYWIYLYLPIQDWRLL